MFSPLLESLTSALICPITKEETKHALFDMAPLKSPRADDLQAFFFPSQWETVGESLFQEVKKFFEEGEFDSTLNSEDSVLLPEEP